jgi:hypothetical protein
MAMDYDAYDALLHHIFKQVRARFLYFLLQTSLFAADRLKVTLGLSQPRRMYLPVSAFVLNPVIFAYFPMKTPTSSLSRQLYAS